MTRGGLLSGGGLLLAAGLPLGAALLAAALLAGCGGHNADETKTGPKVADYYCAPDAKSADAIGAALRSSDEDDYQDAIRFAVPVPPGTSVKIVERVGGTRPKVHTVVLDGEYKGHDCWYPADVEGIFAR